MDILIFIVRVYFSLLQMSSCDCFCCPQLRRVDLLFPFFPIMQSNFLNIITFSYIPIPFISRSHPHLYSKFLYSWKGNKSCILQCYEEPASIWFAEICSLAFPFSFCQVFYTPEGMLSSEQGVYIAEIVAARNTKQSKGRFRMYEEQDGVVLLYKYLVFRFLLFTFSLSSFSFWHDCEEIHCIDLFTIFDSVFRIMSALIILQRENQLIEKCLVLGKRILGSRRRKLARYRFICCFITFVAQK